MPSNASALRVDSKESLSSNLTLSRSERLSRSPHPYHRHHHDIKQDGDIPANGSPTLALRRINTPPQALDNFSPTTYFDADHRKRRKDSTSPSDSGTEADDEKGAFLTGLPAPPLRPRKGLKEGYGTSSPLLTPSYLDDATRRSAFEAETRRRASWQSNTSIDDETTMLREKFTRKRRAELIRRITEIILIGVVGHMAAGKGVTNILQIRSNSALDFSAILGGSRLPAALLAYAAVLPGVYALYPIRIILQNHTRSLSRHRAWYYIHIPAAFDPAALLYPTVLPVLVALSLLQGFPNAVLLNISLGIASIPSKIIPLNENVPWYSSIQWILSGVPVLVAQQWGTGVGGAIRTSGNFAANGESLLCSYLLHQALMPCLGYLTTTSLLPAELQLLSVSLINLLFFATSPQSIILKALLWIGGLSVFVFCGKILRWEVALARVPSWRFHQPKDQTRSHRHSTVIEAIDDSVNGRLSSWGLLSTDLETSDSDGPVMQRNTSLLRKHTHLSRIKAGQTHKINGNAKERWAQPRSAIGDGSQSGFPARNGTIEVPLALRTHQRRFTLPSYVGSPPEKITQESVRRNSDAKPKTTQPWSFRSLTAAQAEILSWMFAIYVYGVVIAVIAIPIRQFIGEYALGGQEPVGWAFGYMFGDIPLIKYLTEDWRLDQWISLPVAADPVSILKTSAWADRFNQVIGSSNIRLLICLYCLSIIAGGLGIVFRLSASVEVDTRRKVFHGMMVAMFLPTIFVDPTFVSLALILTLAIFLLLDLFRASQLPPLSKPLTHFLAPYVDGRDHRGPVIVSHIFLLIGCAIPLWLSLAVTQRKGAPPWESWEVATRDLSMIAGVVCVGMGDAAASLIGRRFGRRRWPWSGGKSLEGSLAFALAVVLGLSFARSWLKFWGWNGDSGDAWSTTLGKAAVAGCGASLTEAVLTGGNDNVIVPIILWLLVRGLEM